MKQQSCSPRRGRTDPAERFASAEAAGARIFPLSPRESVHRADEELAAQIADAPARSFLAWSRSSDCHFLTGLPSSADSRRPTRELISAYASVVPTSPRDIKNEISAQELEDPASRASKEPASAILSLRVHSGLRCRHDCRRFRHRSGRAPECRPAARPTVFKPIANEYRISMPSPGSGEEGRPLLYVKQKKMKIKEDIRFRVSPDDEAHLFMIKSKSVFEFRGRHEVLDVDGAVIGLLVKDFTRSLLRSHWHVRDTSGSELLEAYEASWIIALARRFADLGPDWFSLLTWLPFNFVLRRGEQEMGTYKRVLGKFRDRYVLELASEMRDADRRLIVAFAVGLDALQDR